MEASSCLDEFFESADKETAARFLLLAAVFDCEEKVAVSMLNLRSFLMISLVMSGAPISGSSVGLGD